MSTKMFLANNRYGRKLLWLFFHRRPGHSPRSLPLLLTVSQAAQALGVHVNTVRAWDRSGLLRSIRVGPRRDRRFPRELIMPLVTNQLVSEPLGFGASGGGRGRRARFGFMLLTLLTAAAILLASNKQTPVAAETAERQSFLPATCSGWINALNAETFDLTRLASAAAFSEANSVVFRSRPVEANDLSGSLDAATVFQCTGWQVAERGVADALQDVQLRISLAGIGPSDGEDVITLETSADGAIWLAQKTFLLRDELSNATNDGYMLVAVTGVSNVDQLRALQVRFVPNVVPSPSPSSFLIDGIALEAKVKPAGDLDRQRLEPGVCAGWSNAAAAQRINEKANAPYKQFSERDSAMVERRTAQPELDSTTSSTAKLTCTGFGVLKAALGKNVVDARVVFSLAARGGANSEDVVIPAYSVDGGQSWQTLDPVLVRGELSNRERNGYLSLTLPPTLTRDQLANLTVRIEFVAGEVPDETQVLLDGVALDLSLEKVAKDQRRDFEGLSFLTKWYFLPIEDPVIFLEAEPDSIEVFDARGERVDIAYSTEKESGVGGERKRLELKHQRAIRPGTYTVKLRSKSGKRVVEETQTFSWGLLSINSPKTTYRVGESVPITVGVVDAAGRTVCNADLELFVTAPDGKTATARTSDGTIATSAECGPKSITARPDYLYRFEAMQAGTYSLSLEAKTASGPQTLTSTVEVTDQPAFTIERVGPTRINPKQPYLMHLFVTPESDTKGVVTENIPLGFAVSEVSSGGSVATLDEPQQKVRWDVDWKTGQEYELTYVFDAPDVSPALFTLGPAEVGEIKEIRSWQVASDEVVETDRPGLAYDALKPMPDDWEAAHASLAAPIKPIFRADETAVVKIWDQGFAETGRPATPLTVENLEIVPPPGASAGFDKITEEFVKDGRERSVIYAVPNDTFKPGAYTLRATVTDGASSRIEETIFEWGTLGFAADKPAPKQKTRLTFALNDRDESGTPTCDDKLTLTVTPPSQRVVTLGTDDGSIRRVDCNDPNKQFETTFSPGEVGEYHVLLTRRRGQTERYVESTLTVTERPATPNDVQKSIAQAVDLTAASFPAGEEPSLDVTVVDSAVMGFLGVKSTQRDVTGLTLASPDGSRRDLPVRRVDRKRGGDSVARLSVDTGSFSRPGKYTLSVDVEQGDYLTTVTQDFTWGVLAVNVRRSIELPDSSTDIGMAVLDDRGRTVCDADVTLEVRNPKGKTETFRTADGSIVRDPACVDKGVTNDPDYAATYRTTVNGTYIMTVTADTKNGRRSLTDQFEVRPDAAFDVERSVFPTRIYPLANYAVEFTIVPRQDFRGRVTETVPASLEVADISPTASVAEDRQGHRTLTWEVDWRQGEPYKLSYLIDFPDVAPAFYLLGPLTIGDLSIGSGQAFQEARQWQIASDATTIRVAGTLYSNEGTTAIDCNAANKTVKLEVNNTTGYTTTCTAVGGTYDFGTTISVNASDVLTVYISGATEKGSRTTRVAATPADITGADIYQNRAIVSHEDTGPITNTNLDNWDSGNDADVPYTVTTGALTVASGRKLIVWTGKTFTPGGSVATTAAGTAANPDGDALIQSTATLSMGTNALSVGGDFTNSGTFSKSTGQMTTFTATGTGFAIEDGTSNFDSVTFNGSGGGWSFSSAVILDVDLTMTAGTLSGTNNVTVNGGDATGNGTITLTGGTFLIDGAGNFGGTTAWTFSSLTFGDGTGTTTTTATSTSTITVTSVMTISTSQTLSAGSKTYTLSGSGTPLVVSGTFTRATSTVNYTGTSATTIKSGITYNNLGIGISDANSVTYSYSAAVTGATGDTTVATNDTFSVGSRFDLGNSSTGAGTLTLNGTISGASYMQYYSNTAFPVGGTMNLILWMNGGATGSQSLSARTYGGAVQLLCWCSDTVTLGAGTFNFQNDLRIAENSSGVNYTVDAATNDPTVNVTGSIDYNGNSGTTGVEILNAGAGTWTVSGNVDFKDSGSQAGQYNPETNNLLKMNGTTKTIMTGGNALYNFEISAGSTTASDALTVNNNLTVSGGTLTGPASGTISLGGSFANSSTFTHNSSTVTMTGTSKTISGSSNTTFNNLTISGTVTVTASNPTVNTTLTVDVNKSLTINSGLTVTLAANTGTNLVLNGTIDGAGTLTYKNTATTFPTTGTVSSIVRFDTVNGNLIVPARASFGGDVEAYGNTANVRSVTLGTAGSQTITVTGSVKVITGASQSQILTLDGATNNPAVTITGGISYTKAGSATPAITTGTGAWSAGGDVTLTNGTFTAATGNVLTLNGTAQQTLTTNTQTFIGLTLNNTGTDGTANDDIVISGALDANGTLTITDGQLRLDTNNPNVTTAGAVAIGANGSVTKGTGTWTFDGTTATTYTDSSSAVQNLGAVTFNKTDTVAPATNDKVTLASSMTADTVTIDGTAGQADTLDLGSSGYTLTLANAGATATVLTVSGTLTIGTSTIKYTATNSGGNITVNALSYSSLNLGPSSAETYDVAANQSASGTVTVDTNATMSIATNVTFTHSGSTLTLSGTISGAGTYAYQSATAFPATGTVSSLLRFDATNNNQTASARTYVGQVEFYSNSSSAMRTVTLGSGTLAFSSHFYINAANTQDLTLDGSTYDPTVNVTSDLKMTGSGAGTEIWAAGDGTWTVSGNVDIAGGFYAPNVANLNPSWDNHGYYYETYSDDGFGTCYLSDSGTSCGTASATTFKAGNDLPSNFGTVCAPTTDNYYRAYLKYDLSSIANTNTVIRADQQVNVSSAGAAASILRAGNDTPDAAACASLYGVGGSGANYNSWSSWSAGNQSVNLLPQAVADIQGRLGTTSFAMVMTAGSSSSTLSSTDAASNKPILRVGYAGPSTAPTLVMNGTGTLTTGNASFYNLTLSGTNTVAASSTVNIANTLNMSGTVTNNAASFIMIGTASTINGGGNTIGKLTLYTNAGATLSTSDLTVADTLSILSGATLSLDASRSLTLSGSSFTLTGTISGGGTFIFANGGTFPATGTISSILRMDATAGNETIGGTNSATRTFGGVVEIYNNSGSAARTVTLENGTGRTFTFSSHLYLIANNTQDVTLTADTATDPTINVTGDVDFTVGGAGSEIITSGTGTWTVSGNIDFTNGTYTATSGNTLVMNGTSKTLTSASQSLYNFTVSGGSVTVGDATTITNDLGVTGGTMSGTSNVTVNGNATGTAGVITLTGGTFEQRVSASKNFGPTTASTGWTFSTLTFSNSHASAGITVTTQSCSTCGVTVSTALNIGKNTDAAGATTTLAAGDKTWTLSGSGTSVMVLATSPAAVFTASTSTVNYTGSSATTTAAATYNNLGVGTTSDTGTGVTYTLGGNTAVAGTLTVGNASSTNTDTLAGSSYTLTLSGSVATPLTLTAKGAFSAGTSTVSYTGVNGSGNVNVTTATYSGLTADSSSAETYDVAGSFTASGTLNVGTNATLSIATSQTLTHSGATLTLSGTISGAGTYAYQSATAFPTGGTISSILRFDATNNNQIVSARASGYGGQVELYNNSASAARTVTLGTAGSQTITFSSHLYLNAANTQDLTLDGTTNSPTVNITGDLDFTGAGTGMEVIAAGAGTWTVSGSANFTDGFFAPSVTDLTPTRDRAVKGQFDYLDVGQCPGTKLYSCESETATVLTFGQQINGECGRGADWTDYGWRAGLKYDLSSIPATATVTSAYFAASVAAMLTPSSESVTIGHAATDTPNLDACNEALMADLAPTSYADVVWSTTGSKRVNLGSTAVSDIQSRVAAGSVIALAVDKTTITPPVYGWVEGSINSSESSTGQPTLRVGYVPSGSTAKLIMNGTGTLTTNGFPLNNLDLSGSVTLAGATHTLYGDLNMTSGTITPGSSTVVMAGSSKTVTGGAQTLNNLTVAADTTVQTSNLTVSGALTVNSGKTLTITSVSLTHSGSGMTLTGTVAGTGTLVFTDTSSGPGTAGTLTAPVRFDATNGDIAPTTLDARTYGGAVELYSNSGTAKTVNTAAGTYALSSTLTLTKAGAGGLTFDMNTTDPTAFTVSGALTIGTGTTLSATSSGTFNVNGNYTSNGTFTHNSGTVTLAGTSQQTLSGTMTGSTGQFNNLAVTNSSGSDPDSSPSVIFAAAADTVGTFTAATANVKLRFNAGSTFALYAINFNGQATGTRVFLRSSSNGTQYNLNAGAGSRTVSNTNFRDANACGSTGGSIDASDGTNVDAANNSCLTLNTITISISDTSIGFGACSASAARYATGDTSGSASDSADAHTVTVSSNAANGYALTVTGATLTSGGNTITAIGGSAVASSPGSEQFGLRAIKNSGTGTVSSPYDTSNWAYAGVSGASQIASHTSSASSTVYGLRYLCNVSPVTEPGSYSATLTYIMSAAF